MERAELKGQDHDYERPHGRAEGSASSSKGVHHRYAGLPFGNPNLYVHVLTSPLCSILPPRSARPSLHHPPRVTGRLPDHTFNFGLEKGSKQLEKKTLDMCFTPPRLTTTAGFLASPSQALFPIPLSYNSPLCEGVNSGYC